MAQPVVNEISTRTELVVCAAKIRMWMMALPVDIQQEMRTEFGGMFRAAGLDELEGQRILMDLYMNRPGGVQAFVGRICNHEQLVTAVRKLTVLL